MRLCIAIFSAIFLVSCIDQAVLAKVQVEYSQDDQNAVLTDVDDLIKQFSYVMDLSVLQDVEIYDSVPNEFASKILPKCERSDPCIGSLINSVIRGMYKMYNHISKDQLASGKSPNVSMPTLEKSIFWASTLLDHSLRSPFIAVSMVCTDLNPVHLVTMFRMHETLQKLLNIPVYTAPSVLSCKAADKFGLTPLHIAVLNRDVGIVKLLLSNGADIFILDSFNRTSVDVAESIFHFSGDRQWLDMLLEYQNDCTLLQESGASALRHANEVVSEATVRNTVIDRQSNVDQYINSAQQMCPIDTLHVSNLTYHSFVEGYLSQRKPLLIKGAAAEWPIRGTWQRQYMTQADDFANLEVLIGSIPYADVFGKSSDHVTLFEFIGYLDDLHNNGNQNGDTIPYYIFDPDILSKTDSPQAQSFYDSSVNAHPQWLMDALLGEGISHGRPSSSGEKKTINAEQTRDEKLKAKSPPNTTITKQFYMGPPLSVSQQCAHFPPLFIHCRVTSASWN